MIKPIDIPIVGPSNNAPQDDPQSTMNMYGEKTNDGLWTLKPGPGYEAAYALTVAGGGRGAVSVGGKVYGVRGGYFEEVVDGVGVVRGGLFSITGRVAIIFNLPPNGEIQIMVEDDDNGYVWEVASETWTLLTQVDHGFTGGGAALCFVAGRGLAIIPGTQQWIMSALYNFLSWPGNTLETCQSLNTPLLSVCSDGSRAYLFSSDSFEVWLDQGSTPNPLTRVGFGYGIGILARFSLQVFQEIVYFLGTPGVVYRTAGSAAPQPISDAPTNRQIAAIPGKEDAIGDCYSSLGHTFYLITFTTGNQTLCYDNSTSLWHDRSFRDPATNILFAIKYFSLFVHAGELYGQKYADGAIVRISNDIFTDEGNPIMRFRVLNVIPQNADWQTFYQSVELFGEVGNTPVDQEQTYVMLDVSRDRGKTLEPYGWGNTDSEYGYQTRTKWPSLGAAFGLTLRFSLVCNHYVSWRNVRLRAG